VGERRERARRRRRRNKKKKKKKKRRRKSVLSYRLGQTFKATRRSEEVIM